MTNKTTHNTREEEVLSQARQLGAGSDLCNLIRQALTTAAQEKEEHMKICYEAGKAAAKFESVTSEVAEICKRYGIELPPKNISSNETTV